MLLNPKLRHSLGLFIGKANRVMEKRVNENFAREGYELSMDHWIVMVHLWLEDGRNQKSLCEFAGRNKTRITRTLDNLEAQNYVLRVPDQADRRNKLIYLTHKGKQAQEPLSQIMLGSLEEATTGIKAEDLQTCKKVLQQVFLNLADEEILLRFSEVVSNETIANENISDKAEKS